MPKTLFDDSGVLAKCRVMRDDGLLTDAQYQSLRRAALRFLGDDDA